MQQTMLLVLQVCSFVVLLSIHLLLEDFFPIPSLLTTSSAQRIRFSALAGSSPDVVLGLSARRTKRAPRVAVLSLLEGEASVDVMVVVDEA